MSLAVLMNLGFAGSGAAATTADTFWASSRALELSVSREWQLARARGTRIGTRIAIDTKDQRIDWIRTDYKVEPVGGF